jgi:hypothetical protein
MKKEKLIFILSTNKAKKACTLNSAMPTTDKLLRGARFFWKKAHQQCLFLEKSF